MNVLLVEDEAAAVKRMQKLLAEIDPTIAIVGITEAISTTVSWLGANPAPDLAFFDVQLADGESFEIFKRCPVDCPVIFTTAYDEYAVKAFRVNAIDYLLKPVKKEELEASIDRVRAGAVVSDHGQRATDAEEGSSRAPIKRFLIRYGEHFKVVDVGEIAYIHSYDKSTFLRTREGRDLPLDESLDRLEMQLDPEKFFRINRQVITRIDSIKELLAYSKSRVKVKFEPPYDSDAVVSSERAASFKRWLGGV